MYTQFIGGLQDGFDTNYSLRLISYMRRPMRVTDGMDHVVRPDT